MRKPKANRSYSLDLEVIMMLEKYAAASDIWGKRRSRSKIVNDAIRWYISGDTADLVDSQEKLMAKVRELAIQKNATVDNKQTWWRRLLGLN